MQKIKSLILIADKDPKVRKMLRIALGGADYKTEESKTGQETLRLASCIKPSMLIVDSDFSDIKNLDLIKKLREFFNSPIILTSDDDDDETILSAFELGIDDHIKKPFNVEVLAARVQATLKRSVIQEAGDTLITLGNIVVNLIKHEVKIADKIVQFSPKEYQLLTYLMLNKGKMLTHTQILNKVWGPSHTYNTQYLRVYVGQLRKKIDMDPNSPSIIITESGIGYRI